MENQIEILATDLHGNKLILETCSDQGNFKRDCYAKAAPGWQHIVIYGLARGVKDEVIKDFDPNFDFELYAGIQALGDKFVVFLAQQLGFYLTEICYEGVESQIWAVFINKIIMDDKTLLKNLVRDFLEENINNLDFYLHCFGDRYFEIESRSAIDINTSVTYKYWEDSDFEIYENFDESDLNFEVEKPENFSFNPVDCSCSFSLGYRSYWLRFAELPTDKWGNSAGSGDFEAIDANYKWVYFSTTDFTAFSDDFSFSEFIVNNDLESNFEDWLLDSYPGYEFISEIKNASIASGFYCGFSYLTTNKLCDSQEWQVLFADFKNYWEA